MTKRRMSILTIEVFMLEKDTDYTIDNLKAMETEELIRITESIHMSRVDSEVLRVKRGKNG